MTVLWMHQFYFETLVTVVRNHLHTWCACCVSSCGYYSRAAFISLRASNCAATIRRQCLFKEIWYLF